MSSYLIFRTDKIGDFLLSIILINSIKRNDPDSHITIVCSQKNYQYIKSFKFIDEVILLKNDLFNKIRLINRLRSKYYDFIIVHDLKKRSSIISLFLRYKFKIIPNKSSNLTYISNIKEILSKLKFNFIMSDLNTLSGRDYNSLKFSQNNFILFHFDEKWLQNHYIEEYTNIEPSSDQLISFLNLLISKSNNEIIITTGIDCPKILNHLLAHNLIQKVKIFNDLSFFELENIISKCRLLISCHGSVSHVATAYNIKQIDIIEEKKLFFYSKWTDHFRNYFPIYRKKFSDLSKDIINLI